MTFRRVAPALRRHLAAISLILPAPINSTSRPDRLAKHAHGKFDRCVGERQGRVAQRGFVAHPLADTASAFCTTASRKRPVAPALRACSHASRRWAAISGSPSTIESSPAATWKRWVKRDIVHQAVEVRPVAQLELIFMGQEAQHRVGCGGNVIRPHDELSAIAGGQYDDLFDAFGAQQTGAGPRSGRVRQSRTARGPPPATSDSSGRLPPMSVPQRSPANWEIQKKCTASAKARSAPATAITKCIQKLALSHS